VYAERFAAAHAGLAAADSQLAFELCVDSMPVEDVPQLTTEQVNRVLAWALNTQKLQEKLMDTSSLINEANLEHARTLNKVMLQALVAARGTAAADAAAAGQGCAAAEQLLPITVPPTTSNPVLARVEMPAWYDFKEQLSEFAFRTLLTRPEVISALSKIRQESAKVSDKGLLVGCWRTCSCRVAAPRTCNTASCCIVLCVSALLLLSQFRSIDMEAMSALCVLQVVTMSLFNTFSSKSVRLEEFEQVQFAATDSVANHLRDNWTASIKSIIKYVLQPAGWLASRSQHNLS
jgi:hypothetical protein